MNTPTPKSDKAAKAGAYFRHGDYTSTAGKQLVHLDDCRKIERQLAGLIDLVTPLLVAVSHDQAAHAHRADKAKECLGFIQSIDA